MSQLGFEPLVSVVIPLFNQGCFLDEAVASCRLQTYENVEIVVVDDGSDDPETCRLLADYRRPGVSLVRTPGNEGLAAARNRGARTSRGQLLCFLDADDLLEPTFLEKTAAALRGDPELDVVSCWIEAFGVERWTYKPSRCDLAAVLAECTIATAAVVRRSAFERVGGFDATPVANEDWDFWIAILESGGRAAILPETLFFYRRRAGSMVEQVYYSERQIDVIEILFRRYSRAYGAHLDEILAWKRAEASAMRDEQAWFASQIADRRRRLEAWRRQ